MKLSIPKIEKNEQVFFLAYIIFLVFSLLMHSLYYQRFMYYYSYIIGGCIMILLLQEVARGALSFRSLLGAVVLFFLAFLLVLKGSGNLQTSFACVFVFAFGARDISFKKIGRVTIWVTLAVVIFVILSSMLGIIDNHHVLQSGGARSRYFLGFRYALNPPAMLLNVILLYVYVRRDECTYREIMAWLVLAWALYYFTDSRLTFGLSILGLCIAVYCKRHKEDMGKIDKLSKLMIPVFPLCFLISFWFARSYSSGISWMWKLDTILGGRLRYAHASMTTYGLSLFGNGNIKWVGAGLNPYGQQSTETYFYVDNMYVQVLQRYGVVFMSLFLILTTLVMAQCYKKKEYLLVVLFAIIAMHGLIDDGILYLQMNTFWLLFGSAAFGYLKSRETKQIEEEKTQGQFKFEKI